MPVLSRRIKKKKKKKKKEEEGFVLLFCLFVCCCFQCQDNDGEDADAATKDVVLVEFSDLVYSIPGNYGNLLSLI